MAEGEITSEEQKIPGERVEVESNGVKLRGNYLSVPESDKTPILISHGAAYKQDPVTYFSKLQQVLASRGYSSLVINNEGVGEGKYKSEGTYFINLQTRAQNFIDAADYLAKHSPTNEVILLTGSMNGETACLTLPTLGEKVKALVLLEPAAYRPGAESITFGPEFHNKAWGRDLGVTSEDVEEVRKNEELNNDKLKSTAFTQLEKYKGPLYVAYGENDAVVDPIIQHRYEQEADKHGLLGHTYIVKNTGHKLLTKGDEGLYEDIGNFLDLTVKKMDQEK